MSEPKCGCFPAHDPDKGRRLVEAAEFGWTEIEEKDMTGVPPLGPRVRRPLPVPDMESSKGPHAHCVRCWQESGNLNGLCDICCGELVVCFPMACGSS